MGHTDRPFRGLSAFMRINVVMQARITTFVRMKVVLVPGFGDA
jgi:hypothetical protein